MNAGERNDPGAWYGRLLRAYLAGGDEAVLEDISDLGRLLAATGMPIETIAEAHNLVFAELLSGNAVAAGRLAELAAACQSALLVAWRIAAEGFGSEAAGVAVLPTAETTPAAIIWFTADGAMNLDEEAPVVAFTGSHPLPADLPGLVILLCGQGRAEAVMQAVTQRRIVSLDFPRADGDGHTRLVACPLRDGSGVVVLRDITGQVTAREAAFQRRKLESLGRLAGGLAHEFNNLLQPIISMAQLGLAEHGDKPDLTETFDVILDCARNAADVVRGILTYVRLPGAHLVPFDLGPSVVEAVDALRPMLPVGVELVVLVQQGTGQVAGNRSELAQLLRNLVRNAVDALSGPGRIVVATAPVTVCGIEALRFQVPDGCYQSVSVTDDGPGIPVGLVERIFEPFFTTKDIGKGTGLGLPVVRGIVESWGGRLAVRNRPEGGTVFEALFSEAGGASMEGSKP